MIENTRTRGGVFEQFKQKRNLIRLLTEEGLEKLRFRKRFEGNNIVVTYSYHQDEALRKYRDPTPEGGAI